GSNHSPSALIISAPRPSRLAPMRLMRPSSMSKSATSSRWLLGSMMRAWRISNWVLAYMLGLLLAAGSVTFSLAATHAHGQNCHPNGNTRGHLVENNGARSVGHFGSNVHATINGAGVHYNGFWVRHLLTLIGEAVLVKKLTFRGQES